MSNGNNHDLLAWRLAAILKKLNEGQRLDPETLAVEFGVHKRTIQRDLLDRFAFLPLEKKDGLHALDPAYLGRITFRDMERFASLAGISGLFPGLDTQFMRELFDSRLQETLDIHAGSYENLQQRGDDFRALQQSIGQRRLVRFVYQKAEGEKTIQVAPYRMINHTGIWYLAATDQGRIKAYAFGKIRAIQCLPDRYTPDAAVEATLDQEDSIWLNEKKTEAVLTVAPAAATYFRRRKLIAQQHIVKELENGGLIVSGKFAHPEQILPIVRYWIPHVRIVSPEDWQAKVELQLRNYLNA